MNSSLESSIEKFFVFCLFFSCPFLLFCPFFPFHYSPPPPKQSNIPPNFQREYYSSSRRKTFNWPSKQNAEFVRMNTGCTAYVQQTSFLASRQLQNCKKPTRWSTYLHNNQILISSQPFDICWKYTVTVQLYTITDLSRTSTNSKSGNIVRILMGNMVAYHVQLNLSSISVEPILPQNRFHTFFPHSYFNERQV